MRVCVYEHLCVYECVCVWVCVDANIHCMPRESQAVTIADAPRGGPVTPEGQDHPTSPLGNHSFRDTH